jgi:hypothetical protein
VGADERSLAPLGLKVGERVRWRRRSGGHWHGGVVIGREADGSIAVRDAQGAWRSITVDRLEARVEGRRGAVHWEPLTVRAARPEQLDLWS